MLHTVTKIPFALKEKVADFTSGIFAYFFDEKACQKDLLLLQKSFEKMLVFEAVATKDRRQITALFFDTYPDILKAIEKDAYYILEQDPAAKSIEEVCLAYPGFFAIVVYRVSHELYKLDLHLISRLMSEYAHSETGADIHAGAQITAPFFIDHATGVVIGETTIIAPYVKIFQGVTLGALSTSKHLQNTKRHPTIEKNVCIYAGATILGGDAVIGENSTIGGGVWLTKSVSAYSLVTNTAQITIQNKNNGL